MASLGDSERSRAIPDSLGVGGATGSQEPAAGRSSRCRVAQVFSLHQKGGDLRCCIPESQLVEPNCHSPVSECDPTVTLGRWPGKHLLEFLGPMGWFRLLSLGTRQLSLIKITSWPAKVSFSWHLLAKLSTPYRRLFCSGTDPSCTSNVK